MERISVVIPTHNSSEFIGKTLESVFNQTLKPSEIIVVDDASSDDTGDLVTSIAKQAPVPVVLERLTTNSGGPARPLNVGIERAAGSLIATLDHDDLMLPGKLESQVACLNRDEKIGLVLSNFFFYRNDIKHDVAPLEILRASVEASAMPLGNGCYKVRARDFYAALIDKSMTGSCSNFLFPKRIWTESNGFDEKLTSCCDYRFAQAVAGAHDIGVVDEPLFYYHWRDESLYRTTDRLSRKRDRLRVFRRFEPKLLNSQARARLRSRIKDELLGGAHLSRDSGAYAQSLGLYLESIYRGGWSSAAVCGIAKLTPHKFMDILGTTARPIREKLF